MLAKRFVSRKIEWGFDENKVEESRREKTHAGLEKKTKIGYSVLGLRKPNLRQKVLILKNLTMPNTVKGGPFEIFQHPFCCKISKKLKGGPFGDIKNI